MKKWLLTILVIALLPGIGTAEEGTIPLPLGMSWDITLPQSVELLEEKHPGLEYQIKPCNDSECIVSFKAGEDKQSCELTFSVVGGIDRNVRQITLEDLKNKDTKLTQLGTFDRLQERAQGRNDEMVNQFISTVDDFSAEYGAGKAEYSYLSFNEVGKEEISYNRVPMKGEEVDWDSIRKYLNDHLDSMNNYVLVIGNEHTQCRIKVINLYNSMSLEKNASKTIVGGIDTIISKDKAEPVSTPLSDLSVPTGN